MSLSKNWDHVPAKRWHKVTSRAQREAMLKLWRRVGENALFWPVGVPIRSYRPFRKQFVNHGDFIIGPWCGMWIGVERDGYTHS